MDQGIKLLIKEYCTGANLNIIGDLVRFRPVLNVQYSWINSIMNLGIGLLPHVLLVLLVMVVSWVIYSYLKTKGKDGKLVRYIAVLLFAAGTCSLLDKIFWGGSLDYIYFKGLFVFDLKDIYLTVIEISLVIMATLNYKGLRKVTLRSIFRELSAYVKTGLKKNDGKG